MKLAALSLLLFVDFSYAKDALDICIDYHCELKQEVQINDDEWQTILRPFNQPAVNAKIERQQIRESIALFEKIVGNHTPTYKDLAENSGEDETGLNEIQHIVRTLRRMPLSASIASAAVDVDLWDEYRAHVRKFLRPARKLKVVVDASNGMAAISKTLGRYFVEPPAKVDSVSPASFTAAMVLLPSYHVLLSGTVYESSCHIHIATDNLKCLPFVET